MLNEYRILYTGTLELECDEYDAMKELKKLDLDIKYSDECFIMYHSDIENDIQRIISPTNIKYDSYSFNEFMDGFGDNGESISVEGIEISINDAITKIIRDCTDEVEGNRILNADDFYTETYKIIGEYALMILTMKANDILQFIKDNKGNEHTLKWS